MPKKTVAQIINSGNDYCIQVKGNQPKLQQQIQANIATNKPVDSHFEAEKNRGRNENRLVEIYDDLSGISSDWVGLQKIIHVHRYGNRPTKSAGINCYDEHHFYIISLPINEAKIVFDGIRGHWHIENRLHYVKDVIQNEDNARILDRTAIASLSILKNCAINLFRNNGFNSIKKANIRFANKIEQLMKFICNVFVFD